MQCSMEVKPYLRPCIVQFGDNQTKGLFHKWTTGNDYDYAMVELENGCVVKIHPETMHFLDSDLYFSEINWEEGNNENYIL